MTDWQYLIIFVTVTLLSLLFLGIIIGSIVSSWHENNFCNRHGYDYAIRSDLVDDVPYYECCNDAPGDDVCTWVRG